MTTLRRAALRLLGLDSAPVWILAALLVASTSPAWAASHGGGGGGGHSGGGHSGGGSHMSSGASGHASAFHGGGRFGGRTAIPGRPGGGFSRQPGFRDHFHGGFGRDHFFFGAGFGVGLGFGFGYDPFLWGYFPYAPYWGPPYWANLYYPYYPYDGWEDGYYPAPAYPPGDYAPPADERRAPEPRNRSSRDRGALDLDISPSDTQVYLNGQYVGIVDDFDGWPQYLWLEPGTYDIVFYHEGYKTLARQVTVYPGQKITYNDKLERGQAVRPEDLPSKSHERRDARIQFEDQRSRQLSGQGDNSDWHDRVRSKRGAPAGDMNDAEGDADNPAPGAPGANDSGRMRGRPVDAMPGTPPPPPPPMSDAAADHDPRGGHQARLHLTIEPDDASVYLDGRFVGTAADINERGGGLVVGAGKHRLAVVRPGRKAEERQFDVAGGGDLDVDVKLERINR